jgi:4a-hydroxytetrahydrobiopterin dehydratase
MSASRAGHLGKTKREKILSVPIPTSPAQRMETALCKASVIDRPTRSMLFPSLRGLWNRLRHIVSRPIRNSLAGTEGASKSSMPSTAVDKPKILTAKELRVIMPRLAGWKLAQNKLSRTFEFQDFVHSLSFVNSLVAYFETVDHHPDVRIAYGEVTFELTRYDMGGNVTDRDVEVAKKISSTYRARS